MPNEADNRPNNQTKCSHPAEQGTDNLPNCGILLIFATKNNTTSSNMAALQLVGNDDSNMAAWQLVGNDDSNMAAWQLVGNDDSNMAAWQLVSNDDSNMAAWQLEHIKH